MKRYIVCEEYFGGRVYDSVKMTEKYFDKQNYNKIVELLEDDYEVINHKWFDDTFSAPLKISMNITKKCNLRCKQCFSDSGEMKQKELTLEDVWVAGNHLLGRTYLIY